ncbi:MAG: endonuclease/exonuclease/phosphatase family protein [Thermomicrobiales bacterium]|nr:endonuclease/exonuclease/phosphatase family protein [Thermomicrobiales bacterium]
MLKVMTYNVGDGLAQPAQLVEMLRESAADIIGIQELAPDQGDAIAQSLDDVYPHQVLHPDGIPGKGILSRFPLTETTQLDLHPGRPDLQGRVETPEGNLTVLVAHPPPPRFGRNRLQLDALSNDQIRQIIESVSTGDPVVLLTDFNRLTWHAAYRQLTAAGLIDAYARAGAGIGFTLPTRLGHHGSRHLPLARLPLPPILRVDYVWHTPHFQTVESWLGRNAGSDHLPVLANLERVR